MLIYTQLSVTKFQDDSICISDILSIMEHMNHNLEQCRKSLLNHLERRRQIFPRFYFLSMEDVLHIVCNGEFLQLSFKDTVELQWLEHLWNHENMFETGGII